MSGPQVYMPQVGVGSDGLHFTPGSVNAPQMTGPSMSDPYMNAPQMNINTPTFQPGMPQAPQMPGSMPQGMPGGMPQAAPPNNKMIFIALGVLLLVAIVVVVVFAMKK